MINMRLPAQPKIVRSASPCWRAFAQRLGVQSRGQVDRIDAEAIWLFGPCRADSFVRCKAMKGLEPPGEVVSIEEGGKVIFKLPVGLLVISPDGCLLQRPVHPFDLAVIRYVICGALSSCCSSFGRPYGEPIRDVGHREHEGAGRPSIDRGLRARARYMAAPRDFPRCAASADQ